MGEPRGAWGGVCCSTDHDKAAVRSWVKQFVPEDWGDPIAAQIYEHFYDDRAPRFRVLFRRPDGEYRQALRSANRRGWSVTIGRPSPALLKYAGVR